MNDDISHPPSMEHAKAEAERYINGVVKKSITWYHSHGRTNNVFYNCTRVGIVVLSLSLPAISVFAKGSPSSWPADALLVIPIIVAVLAALDGLFQWGELWKSRTSTELALRRIKREFWTDWNTLMLEPESERVEKAYAKYKALVTEVEATMINEEETFWGRRIQQLKRPTNQTA